MKRWAFLTVFLYLLAISFLATPILGFVGGGDGEDFVTAFFAFLVPALLVIQGLLLLIPVQTVEGRPTRKRTVAASATGAGLALAALLTGLVWFLIIMVLGEDRGLTDAMGWLNLGLFVLLWLWWGVVFYRGFDPKDPGSWIASVTQWLLAGSILEVLVAIPAHIISRHRGDCCAPGFTLFGLVTGIAVAVMAFGPAFFLLLAGKVREKKKAA